MKHHETVVIRSGDIGARCGDISARCGDVCVWGSDVDDRAEVIRCDDIADLCRDVIARCGDVARRGDMIVEADNSFIVIHNFIWQHHFQLHPCMMQ